MHFVVQPLKNDSSYYLRPFKKSPQGYKLTIQECKINKKFHGGAGSFSLTDETTCY